MPPPDAIVVGSGFAGSIAALRLAQAGLRVLIVERGRRWPPGTFPRDYGKLDGWLYSHDRGIFDVRLFPQMRVIQGAGWGGGSLVYANVHVRTPPEVFDNWPDGLRREDLDPYYDRVAQMLGLAQIGADGRMPPKALRMQEAADGLGRGWSFFRPDLAIDFKKCTFCGECDVGCNLGAKNTLDLNYLAQAEATGRLESLTETEVTALSSAPDGGWRVVLRDKAGALSTRSAPALFLCAGAVNTTELLLRAREDGLALSETLGTRYSGNADVFGGFYGTRDPFEPWNGPTITSSLVYDRDADDQPDSTLWFMVQDGGYPKPLAHFAQLFDPRLGDKALGAGHWLFDELLNHLKNNARPVEGEAALVHSGILLAMGRDLADGRLEMDSSRKLRISFDLRKTLPLVTTQLRLASDVARQLGGVLNPDPFWKLLHLPVAVHNLGGAPMGASKDKGVVDSEGEVHGQPGLFVLDGAAIPVSLGANPSHTIAAVAERNIERFLRRRIFDYALPASPPFPDRLARSHVLRPPGGSAPPLTPAIGLSFTETMHGWLAPEELAQGDFARGEAEGRKQSLTARFVVTITIDDLDAFLADDQHTAVATGTIEAAGFTPPQGVPISQGVFNLFTQAAMGEKRMLYALPFEGPPGSGVEPLLLDGYKGIAPDDATDAWRQTTTLYTALRAGNSRNGPVLARGILRLSPSDFARQLTTFRITGTTSTLEKLSALSRFGRAFAKALWESHEHLMPAEGP